MVGAFRLDPHLFEGQLDLTSDVFPTVIRSNIHVARVIMWDPGRFALLVEAEEIELQFRTEPELIATFRCIVRSLFQKPPAVVFKRRAVRVGDVTVHTYNASAIRTPGQAG